MRHILEIEKLYKLAEKEYGVDSIFTGRSRSLHLNCHPNFITAAVVNELRGMFKNKGISDDEQLIMMERRVILSRNQNDLLGIYYGLDGLIERLSSLYEGYEDNVFSLLFLTDIKQLYENKKSEQKFHVAHRVLRCYKAFGSLDEDSILLRFAKLAKDAGKV